MERVILALVILILIGCTKTEQVDDEEQPTLIEYKVDYTGDLYDYGIFIYLEPEAAPVHFFGTSTFSHEFNPPDNMVKVKFFVRVTAPGELNMRILKNGETVVEKTETIEDDVIVKQIQIEYDL